MVQKKLRYGCIGAGGIADKKHLKQYSELENVEMTAICDVDAKAATRLAEKYGIHNIYCDYTKMFQEQDLDIISICTPNFLHAPIGLEALKRGIHVHCEKPLAMNSGEILALLEQKKDTDAKLMVALNNRFTSEAKFIKRLAGESFFGEIYHAKCGWKRNSGIPGIGKWFTNKKMSGGGALIDLGVHFLDLTLYFMGYPKAKSVTGAIYSSFADCRERIRQGYSCAGNGVFDVEDTAVGMVRLKNGATIDFDFSWASNIEKEVKYVELLGTKGGVSLINGEVKLFSCEAGVCVTTQPDMKTIPTASCESREFVACILKNEEPLATAEQAYELMKIIDAAYLAAELQKEIEVDKTHITVVSDMIPVNY